MNVVCDGAILSLLHAQTIAVMTLPDGHVAGISLPCAGVVGKGLPQVVGQIPGRIVSKAIAAIVRVTVQDFAGLSGPSALNLAAPTIATRRVSPRVVFKAE